MAANMQRRTPRGVREAKAYRAVQVGAVGAVGFMITTLLWIVGAMNDHPAIVFLLVTIICVTRFSMLTGVHQRRR